MVFDIDKLKAFLNYKATKINSVSTMESKRLDDLKDARSTVFKYALPLSVINSAIGIIAAFKTSLGISILFPVALFVILIYFLADSLDKQKHKERIEIIGYTDKDLRQMREQEINLLEDSL